MSNISVTPIDAGFKPTANYPRPVLFQDSGRALLYFTGRSEPEKEEERVVAVFGGCLASRFGYPNDEALAGHPLHKDGLSFYGVFEVHGSPWMKEVKMQNRVSFPKFDMPERRHIVITLHDESFEVPCEDICHSSSRRVPAGEFVAHCFQNRMKTPNQSPEPTWLATAVCPTSFSARHAAVLTWLSFGR